jgi:hypothetical protein
MNTDDSAHGSRLRVSDHEDSVRVSVQPSTV